MGIRYVCAVVTAMACMGGTPAAARAQVAELTVGISPAGGAVSGSTSVALAFCESVIGTSGIVDSTRRIVLNGVSINSSFPANQHTIFGNCFDHATTSATVPFQSGANVLEVSIRNSAGVMASSVVTFMLSPPGVRVVAASSAASLPAGTPITAHFLVTNTGAVTDTFAFTAACTGPGLAASPCTLGVPSQPVSAGQTYNLTVTAAMGSTFGTRGSIAVLATRNSDHTVRDSTFTEAQVITRPVGLDVVDANPGVSFNRAACLTIAVARAIADECGDLRIAHALPSVRTFNKSRTPTMVYNAGLANATRHIRALLTIPSSAVGLTSVTGTLRAAKHVVGGTQVVISSGTWPGSDWGSLAATTTRQIELQWDSGQAPGLYDYTFTTVRTYANLTTATDSATGQYISHNRFSGLFEAQGWAIAGLEQIQVVDSAIVWTDGDGSTQLYVPSGTTNVWVPKTYVAGRDSITYDGAKYYTRHAVHGGTIVFNGVSGQDSVATDRLGHQTAFRYDAFGRLSKIVLPTLSPDTTMYYGFVYDTNFALKLVTAPGPLGTPDTVKVLTQRLAQTQAASLMSITDLDGLTTRFAYTKMSDSSVVIQSRTDKRNTVTSFTFNPMTRQLASVTMPVPNKSSIAHSFTTPGFGTAGPGIASPHAVDPDSAFIVLHGPRANAGADSADTARFWVDRFWQPAIIRDAHGAATLIAHDNNVFPTVPTRVKYANQREKEFVHGDGRGNVTAIKDSGTVINGVMAITSYTYDPKWDFVTRIDPPLHDSVDFVYDSITGNRTLQQYAQRPGSRITYNYYATSRLLSSTVLPSDTSQTAAHDSVEYDAVLANLSATRTPLGFWTLIRTDHIGRDTLTITPIVGTDLAHDPGSPVRDSVRTIYDAMERPTFTLTIAPPFNGLGRQSQSVSTSYDPEGAVGSTQQALSPDPANLQQITTTYFYDAAGRLSFTQHPDNSKDSTYYDAAGNADTLYTRRGYKIAQTFDALNHVTQRIVPSARYPSLTVGIAAEPISPTQNPPYGNLTIDGDAAVFAYDPMGHMAEADNVDAHVSRVYDVGERLVSETQRVRTRGDQNFNMHVYKVGYTYDLNDRRIDVLHPSQLAAVVSGQLRDTTIYGYDQFTGWLTTVREPLGGLFTYGYTNRGDLRSLIYSDNATQEVYTTDNDGRLTVDAVGPVHGAASSRLTAFVFDARGKIDSSSNRFGLQDTVSAQYSSMGHVIQHSAVYTFPAADGGTPFRGTEVESYTLDPLGNMMSSFSTSNFAPSGLEEPTTQLTLAGYRNRVG